MRILAFTGSRADYYLQRPYLLRLQNDPRFTLGLIVSGGILTEASNQTLHDIENDNLNICQLIPLESNVEEITHAHHIAYLLPKIVSSIKDFNPDLCIIYADRYESFAFALASFQSDRILLHVEAGDITNGGTYDDSIRHSISCMSHLFATSTISALEYSRRNCNQYWRSKFIGLTSFDTMNSLSRDKGLKVLSDLNLDCNLPVVIATMHPIPRFPSITQAETKEFFDALRLLSSHINVNIILTSPNHDDGHLIIKRLIEKLLDESPSVCYVESLGGKRYHSLLSLASYLPVIVAGNSSSIIKEAPFYGAHGLNIGKRQAGRVSATTQIDVDANSHAILCELTRLLSVPCSIGQNPYYRPNSSSTLIEFIWDTLSSRDKVELISKHWS